MFSAWLLPEHLADVLPSEAKRIEGLRRSWLEQAASYGYELVMPPLVEHLESLLSGTASALGLQTFKLVDQLSGRMLGLRADTTPQVARIDAHLLNRSGVVRLAYCGPVVHTQPAGPWASREPLQFGAEIYGHAGLEAELESLELAIDGLQAVGVQDLVLDLGDTRIVQALLARGGLEDSGQRRLVLEALAAKDVSALTAALRQCAGVPPNAAEALSALLSLYGGPEVLASARTLFTEIPEAIQAVESLQRLIDALAATHPEVRWNIDLADAGGQDYYSGLRFSLLSASSVQALVRGGRYDHVGRIFGRERPAVGFSLDLKVIAQVLATAGSLPQASPAIRAPWSEEPALRRAVRSLRARGEAVVCVMPGHPSESQEFFCDRELVRVGDQWVVQAIV